MNATIFYSWQNDLDKKTNRYFIEDALGDALKRLNRDDGAAFDNDHQLIARLDRDTQGMPGSPDIVNAIFAKIDKCHIFVADISIINSTFDGRKTSNPNVLMELGYAVKHLGWEQIICVFNNSSGKIEDLPFDINHRRILSYSFTDGEKKTDAKKRLGDTFYVAIRAGLENISVRPVEIKNVDEVELRRRDIRTLLTLLETINTHAVDRFFESGKGGKFHAEIFFYEGDFESFVASSSFYICNKVLAEKINALYLTWQNSLSFGDDFFPEDRALVLSFKPSKNLEEADWKHDFHNFQSALLDTERAFKEFIRYVQENYKEIDIDQTNQVALISYQKFKSKLSKRFTDQ